MFEDEQVIKLCIKEHLSVEQYFFMWLVRKQDFNLPDTKSIARQYVKLVKAFDMRDIRDLVERGYVDDFNSPGMSNPDLYVLTHKAGLIFTDEESGEELFRKYPATFPFQGQPGVFLARTGAPKDDLIDEYLKKIGYSRKKHEFAMRQLEKYAFLVKEGKMNGKRIVDWVREELWLSVASYVEEQQQGFEDHEL